MGKTASYEMVKQVKGLSKFVFGKRVFKARSIRGESQERIANKIGRSNGYLSNIENGKNLASLDRAVAIANALKVPLDYLCGRDDYIEYKAKTLGDIAQGLMVLSFLKGVVVREEERLFDCARYDKDDVNFEKPILYKEKRKVQIIEIQEGELRHFLHQYQEIFERPHANAFFPQLEQRLAKLDQIDIETEADTAKWEERVRRFTDGKWKISKEEIERIIWNRVPSTLE